MLLALHHLLTRNDKEIGCKSDLVHQWLIEHVLYLANCCGVHSQNHPCQSAVEMGHGRALIESMEVGACLARKVKAWVSE